VSETIKTPLDIIGDLQSLFYDDFNNMKELISKDILSEVNDVDLIFFDKLFVTEKNIDAIYNKDLYKETRGKRAVYIFKIIKDLHFNHSIYIQKAAPPRDLNLRDYSINDILYVGKSLSVGPRIREHHSETPSDTSSLVLGSSKRSFLIGNYRLYIFSLKKEYVSTGKHPFIFEKLILSGVESILHEKLLPKLGSSRT
jgi:hypothetical protein